MNDSGFIPPGDARDESSPESAPASLSALAPRLLHLLDRGRRRSVLMPPAICLAIGIWLDYELAFAAWTYVLVALGAGCGAVVQKWRRSAGGAVDASGALFVLVSIMAAAVGGALHHFTFYETPPNHIVHVTHAGDATLATVRGLVVAPPTLSRKRTGIAAAWSFSRDRTYLLLDTESADVGDGDVNVTGRVRVSIDEPMLDIEVGDRVELFGRLYRPRPPDNPGQLDWSLTQRRNGIRVGMACKYAAAVQVIKGESSYETNIARLLNRLRNRIHGIVLDDMAAHGSDETSLISAMVLAQRSRLDPRIHRAFVSTGTSHFLAASGFHVGMLAFFVYWVGTACGLSRRPLSIVVACVVIAYAILAEPRPPIFRATVLIVMLCASGITNRPASSLNALAAAAMIYLVWQPTQLFDAGFQLSYVCVLGILLLSPVILDWGRDVQIGWRRRRYGDDSDILCTRPSPDVQTESVTDRMWRSTGLTVACSLAAWLSSTPIMITTFHQIFPYGWLVSLFIFPLVAALMFVGFATLLVGVVSPWLAMMFDAALTPMAGALIGWVTLFGHLPGARITCTSPPWGWQAAWYGGIVALVGLHRAGRVGMRLQNVWMPASGNHCDRWRFVTRFGPIALLPLLLATIYWQFAPRGDGALHMTLLSVGRGTSTAIRLPDGNAILYDAGTSRTYDVGANTIVPFLQDQRISRLRGVIISHPNADHYNGLPGVLESTPADTLWISRHFEPTSQRDELPSRLLLEYLAEQGQQVEFMDTQTGSVNLGGAVFEVLWPPPELPDNTSANDGSIVVRITHAGSSILLAGDIDEQGQTALLASGLDLHADVLVLPHHGSVRSTTAAFIDAVAPRYLLNTAGVRSDTALRKLADAVGERDVLTTSDVGAITVRMDESGIEISHFGGAVD